MVVLKYRYLIQLSCIIFISMYAYIGQKMGVTDFINPRDLDKPVHEVSNLHRFIIYENI